MGLCLPHSPALASGMALAWPIAETTATLKAELETEVWMGTSCSALMIRDELDSCS